jgi:hypothetical protein
LQGFRTPLGKQGFSIWKEQTESGNFTKTNPFPQTKDLSASKVLQCSKINKYTGKRGRGLFEGNSAIFYACFRSDKKFPNFLS